MLVVFKNIKIGVFLSFVNLLIQGTAFLVQNFIAKNLGNESYGFFGILQNDYTIFCALADFGMTTLILAFFANRAVKGKLFTQIIQLRFFASFATALGMLLFAFFIRKDHPVFCGELILIPGLILQHAFFDWYFTCAAFWKQLLISKILHAISYASVMGIALIYLKLESIEAIAFCMVLAALPAWAFGVSHAFKKQIFTISKRTFRFIHLMYKAAFPYALASLASFAYLPIGLYFVDYFAPPSLLSAYNYANKLIVLASGFMVHFISSSLISLHKQNDSKVHFKDQVIFVFFITLCSLPIFLFPQKILSLLFFAANWTPDVLKYSAFVLQVLACSLIFQAIRMPCISLLLKEKFIWKYVLLISIGGAFNIICCYLGISYFGVENAPLFVLSGDILFTLLLIIDALKNKRFVL
jgi:O-antigen/teichoic acid export membrane protein